MKNVRNLIISLLLVVGILKTIQNSKTIIDNAKSETVDALDSNNYQELLNKVEELEIKNNQLNTTVETLNTRLSEVSTMVNKKCVATADMNGNHLYISSNSGTDYKLNLVNLRKSSNCGISLENGNIKIDSNINKVLISVTAYYFSYSGGILSLSVKDASTSTTLMAASGRPVKTKVPSTSYDGIHTVTSAPFLLDVSSTSRLLTIYASDWGKTSFTVGGEPTSTFVTIEVME